MINLFNKANDFIKMITLHSKTNVCIDRYIYIYTHIYLFVCVCVRVLLKAGWQALQRPLVKRLFYVFLGMFRAHMGQYGPGPGPYEGEKVHGKTNFFFVHNTYVSTIIVSDLHMTLFHSFNVFFRFLAEKCFRTIMKLPPKTSFRSEVCEIWPRVGNRTCPSCPKSS